MKNFLINLIVVSICLAVILTSGCTNQNEPVSDGESNYPSEEKEEQNEEEKGTIERPTIDIADIDIIELTATEATIDVTVVVHNPNSVEGTFNNISYTLYFKDERPLRGSGAYEYLGYSVNEKKVAINTGDTTLHILFTLENQAVLQTLTTLAVQGQVWIKIVGVANLNLKLFSYDLPFEQEILVPL